MARVRHLSFKEGRERYYRDLLFMSTDKQQIADFLNTNVTHLKTTILKRRQAAVLKYIVFNPKKKAVPESICWYCKHCTNKYGKCSWSESLTPREDWTKDSCVQVENGIRVHQCNGFEIDDSSPIERHEIQIILFDFFQNLECAISRKFFTSLKNQELQEWLDIYNNVLASVGLPILYIRRYKMNKEK